MSRFGHAARKSTQTARGLRTMARAGMLSGTSLGRAVSGMRGVRSWGPLVSGLRLAVADKPDAIGLVDDWGSLTYRELDRRSDALAQAMSARGLAAGHIVAVLCRDHRWMIETLLACGKLGTHVLLLNTGFAAPQLADVINRERADLLIHDSEFTELVLDGRVRLPRFIAWPEARSHRQQRPSTLEDLIAEPVDGALGAPPTPGSVVLLTSGTTGRPKGAKREVRSALSSAEFLDRIPLRANETTFVAAPMFHAVGYSQLILGFALRSTLVVQRRFHAAALAQAVRDHRCTAVVLVPTMLQRLLELPREQLSECMRSLRIVLVSGAPLLPSLSEQTIGQLGDVLYNLYGSTEAAVVTVATSTDLRAAPGTAGRSPHSGTLRLFDERGIRITQPYVSGRIFAGNTLTSAEGYVHHKTNNGLIGTGDIGHFDGNGLLFVDGRLDDMIISGGENVFPREVEDVIARHYEVKDVAVIGMDDHEFGQRLRAFVVRIPGTELNADEIKEYVRNSLAKHKVPREVHMVDTVPRNATGKVVRASLTRAPNGGPQRLSRG